MTKNAETNGSEAELPSAELFEQYCRGSESAADAIFQRYAERLISMVRGKIGAQCRSRFDPEDVVFSAFRSFFVRTRRGAFQLRRSGDLWKLLITISLNKLRRKIAHHRAGKRAVERDGSSLGIAELCSQTPTPLESLASLEELQSFMAKLTPLQRQVLELRLQEHRWDEIAAATERSERTVRRALEELRQRWEAELRAFQEGDES